MSKIEEFAEHCTKFLNMVILCNGYVKYLSYFNGEKRTVEEKRVASISSHAGFISSAFLKCTIIELTKLFHKSEYINHFNINAFIDKLEGEWGEYGSQLMTLEEHKLFLTNNEVLIEKLITARNKIFAHSDKDQPKMSDILINPDEFDKLVAFLLTFIEDIFSNSIQSMRKIKFGDINYEADTLNILQLIYDDHLQKKEDN